MFLQFPLLLPFFQEKRCVICMSYVLKKMIKNIKTFDVLIVSNQKNKTSKARIKI